MPCLLSFRIKPKSSKYCVRALRSIFDGVLAVSIRNKIKNYFNHFYMTSVFFVNGKKMLRFDLFVSCTNVHIPNPARPQSITFYFFSISYDFLLHFFVGSYFYFVRVLRFVAFFSHSSCEWKKKCSALKKSCCWLFKSSSVFSQSSLLWEILACMVALVA